MPEYVRFVLPAHSIEEEGVKGSELVQRNDRCRCNVYLSHRGVRSVERCGSGRCIAEMANFRTTLLKYALSYVINKSESIF